MDYCHQMTFAPTTEYFNHRQHPLTYINRTVNSMHGAS
jgi:hypothetical protein